jgi:hypothetical protein
MTPLIDGLAAGSRPEDSRSRESIPLGASLNPLNFLLLVRYPYRGIVR